MKGDRECLEKVQRKAVGMVTFILRCKGITQGLDRVDWGIWFKTVEESRGAGVRTRQDTAGQLTKEPLGLEVRRHFFSERVVDPWNNLSESVRRSSSVNMFKNKCMKGRGQVV